MADYIHLPNYELIKCIFIAIQIWGKFSALCWNADGKQEQPEILLSWGLLWSRWDRQEPNMQTDAWIIATGHPLNEGDWTWSRRTFREKRLQGSLWVAWTSSWAIFCPQGGPWAHRWASWGQFPEWDSTVGISRQPSWQLGKMSTLDLKGELNGIPQLPLQDSVWLGVREPEREWVVGWGAGRVGRSQAL